MSRKKSARALPTLSEKPNSPPRGTPSRVLHTTLFVLTVPANVPPEVASSPIRAWIQEAVDNPNSASVLQLTASFPLCQVALSILTVPRNIMEELVYVPCDRESAGGGPKLRVTLSLRTGRLPHAIQFSKPGGQPSNANPLYRAILPRQTFQRCGDLRSRAFTRSCVSRLGSERRGSMPLWTVRQGIFVPAERRCPFKLPRRQGASVSPQACSPIGRSLAGLCISRRAG